MILYSRMGHPSWCEFVRDTFQDVTSNINIWEPYIFCNLLQQLWLATHTLHFPAIIMSGGCGEMWYSQFLPCFPNPLIPQESLKSSSKRRFLSHYPFYLKLAILFVSSFIFDQVVTSEIRCGKTRRNFFTKRCSTESMLGTLLQNAYFIRVIWLLYKKRRTLDGQLGITIPRTFPLKNTRKLTELPYVTTASAWQTPLVVKKKELDATWESGKKIHLPLGWRRRISLTTCWERS